MAKRRRSKKELQEVEAGHEALVQRILARAIDEVLLQAYRRNLSDRELMAPGLWMKTEGGRTLEEQRETIARQRAAEQVAPLVLPIQSAVIGTIAGLLAGMFRDPILRKDAISTVSRMAEKQRRRVARKYPHAEWIRSKLGALLLKYSDAVPPLTAKELYEELKSDVDVDEGQDGDKFQINLDVLESLGWRPGMKTEVSFKAVQRILTEYRI